MSIEDVKKRVDKFDGNDYSIWRSQIEDYLSMKKLAKTSSGKLPKEMKEEVSVFSPLESKELREVEAKLEKEQMGLYDYKVGRNTVRTNVWRKKFMKSVSEVEHEAFLVLVVQLSKGTQIALAPAILAHIDRNLSLLKRTIVDSSKLNDRDHVVKLVLKSQFQSVQVWMWEIFLELRANHNVINYTEPRLARWHKVDGLNVKDLRRVLDLDGEGFMWRPYAMAINIPKYYVEKEEWALVGPTLDDELLEFVMSLRVTKIVGFGTKQQYFPHRVAMQFGYDQDILDFVALLNSNFNDTWN
ncbi:uncharacterized protein LOC126792179 [Argentina anserina]|uniref:uncharacterized protein LOC126792179 n=1 Tax=Argentina anserina TaxID=57926 RepID=UPI0021764CD7|nr:uncharacterized protein LOC126792179 [Potentilla anserina]